MFMKKVFGSFLLALALFCIPERGAWAAETMADYTDYPIFMTNTVTPNVLIIMDNSGSMNDQAYTAAYDSTATYYGYFTSTFCYNYSSNVFNISATSGSCASTDFSGNFLNWATMRRVDVGRKVLVGGTATSRTGGGNTNLIGDSGNGWWVWKYGPTSGTSGVTPYSNASGKKLTYELSDGYLYIYEYTSSQNPESDWGTLIAQYTIKVHKDSTTESGDFYNGDISGIMQRVSTKARWGIEFFNNSGCGSGEGCGGSGRDGGNVSQPITGTGYGTNFLTDVENKAATSWTPLAEALYEAAGYFAQATTLNGATIRYNNNDYPIAVGASKDPLYYTDSSQYVPCAKNFVLLITDGDSTMDTNIPAYLKDYDADSQDPVGTYAGSYGTDYLDDVALWAHTTDLRSALTGTQSLTIYTVYAFGNSATAKTLLQNAAKNGAFVDSNSNSLPDIQSEWASLGRTIDGAIVPDTYYQASDGAALESQLMAAITDILKRATSGTAISVLATSGSGAGNIFQAYFLPAKTIVDSGGTRDLTWLGHLLSFNIDSNGSLRDKTNQCIAFSFDTVQNQTLINTLSESAGICGTTVTGSTALTSYTNYNWDAGDKLLAKTPDTRWIFTFLDENNNGVVDGNTNGTLDSGEVYQFKTTNALRLSRYMRTSSVQTPPYQDSLNIINWVRGSAVTSGGVSVTTPFRDRTIDSTKPTEQWKLGDIVHSTPTVVGPPTEAYGLLYQDSTYNSFLDTYRTRSNVVYIGANDGMLHAFNSSTGEELWAYIPYVLIPHLKWLTDTTYTHVNYVDLKVKVTDVNFGTTAAPSWKTILIGGLRFGGGEISDEGYDVDGNGDTPATDIRKFRSSFFVLDVTDSATPKVLGEFGYNLAAGGLSDNALGFSMTYPAIVKVGDSFFAVVGTGTNSAYIPNFKGENISQAGRIFVINLKTMALATSFAVSDTKSYFSDPIAVDIDFSTQNKVYNSLADSGTVSYNTEAVYVGETYYVSTGGGYWAGRMWRLATNGDTDPTKWSFGMLYSTTSTANNQPISASPAASSDESGNLWVFFGTGKYYSDTDKTDGNTQSFYGIKDPCWTSSTLAWDTACLSSSASTASVTVSNLLNVSGTNVYTSGTVSGGSTGATTFTGLSSLVAAKKGWYTNLTASTTSVKEKSLNKPTVFGGLVMFTTFIPNNDVCGLGGNSYIYAVYYLTGTAYTTSAIGEGAAGLVYGRTQTSSVGMASSIAIHSGRESGAKAFVQMSTGETTSLTTNPVSSIKSAVITWREL